MKAPRIRRVAEGDADLADLAKAIRRMQPPLLQTHLIFNNNMEDQGQRNAKTLTEMLDLADAGA